MSRPRPPTSRSGPGLSSWTRTRLFPPAGITPRRRRARIPRSLRSSPTNYPGDRGNRNRPRKPDTLLRIAPRGRSPQNRKALSAARCRLLLSRLPEGSQRKRLGTGPGMVECWARPPARWIRAGHSRRNERPWTGAAHQARIRLAGARASRRKGKPRASEAGCRYRQLAADHQGQGGRLSGRRLLSVPHPERPSSERKPYLCHSSLLISLESQPNVKPPNPRFYQMRYMQSSAKQYAKFEFMFDQLMLVSLCVKEGLFTWPGV